MNIVQQRLRYRIGGACLIVVALFVCMPFVSGEHNGGSAQLSAQSSRSPQSIKAQKRRLTRLQRSIEKTRSEIRQMNKKESSMVKSLNLYRKQSEQLASSIELIDGQLTRVQDSISQHQASLQSLEGELVTLQNHYASLLRIVQKAGTASDRELIMTGTSYDQDVRHSKYLQNITELANSKAAEIVSLKQAILARKQKLDTLFVQNKQLKEQKSNEQQELGTVINTNKEVLQKIRSNKTLLEKQLDEKRESAGKVQRIIGLLAAKEEQRQKEAKRRRQEAVQRAAKNSRSSKPSIASTEQPRRGGSFTGADAPDGPGNGPAFSRRSLPWPVSSRTIIHKFGTSTNPTTKVTTENLGIGIRTARGTPVSAVSSGVVSLVHWLPGYGSLVIVDHGNGFRTVYANLSSVSVGEGEPVKTGNTVGRSGESVDGEYVHFEIWHGREKLNPSEWLN
jgi:septal ring factor EnvC (AmiA/AmiB activator)